MHRPPDGTHRTEALEGRSHALYGNIPPISDAFPQEFDLQPAYNVITVQVVDDLGNGFWTVLFKHSDVQVCCWK